MNSNSDNTEYRYWINPHTGDIMRGRMYRVSDIYDTSDQWRWYWEGDGQTAFTIYWQNGRQHVNAITDNDVDNERVARAIEAHRNYGSEHETFEDMLNRPGGLAFRLTGQWDARFICAGLDRDYDVYALSWDGDPENTWRDEIESVYNGEIYRVSTWVHRPNEGLADPWVEDDDECEEWYGEDVAREAFVKNWPLDEFPAELLVETMPLSDSSMTFNNRLEVSAS
jgi:hypothetical protein